MVRRHPCRDAVPLGASEEIAHLRDPPRATRRSRSAHAAGYRYPRLSGHSRQSADQGRLHIDCARADTLSDRARLFACRQACALEKPIALELWEADELILLAKRGNLKFTIGYSQRFNPKIAYAKAKIADGTLGRPVSVLVSRHLSRSLGKKIASRVRLSPAVMESTHDLDFVFWMLAPAKPARIYSQGAFGCMQSINGSYDVMWTTVTMDNGVVVVIGGGWTCHRAIRTTAPPGSRSPVPRAR